MNVLLLILWIVIGAINIAGAAANGGEVSIINYLCCWAALVAFLAARCFD